MSIQPMPHANPVNSNRIAAVRIRVRQSWDAASGSNVSATGVTAHAIVTANPIAKARRRAAVCLTVSAIGRVRKARTASSVARPWLPPG